MKYFNAAKITQTYSRVCACVFFVFMFVYMYVCVSVRLLAEFIDKLARITCYRQSCWSELTVLHYVF
jgi:Ca2+/Na+ antiporter